MNIRKIESLLKERGWEPEELGDYVYSYKSDEAHDINKGGMCEQIKYLIRAEGETPFLKNFNLNLEDLVYTGKEPPEVGDTIYVGSSFYIDHGEDDFEGGLAEVSEVKEMTSGGKPTPFVSIKERPGTSYNWRILADEQEKLAKEFGTKRSYPDPDIRRG
jgi:hypothetical protein